jgi:hypothetical protein
MSHVAAINYGSAPSVVENVFMVETDDNLHADHYDPSSGWSWANLGRPGDVTLNPDLAAINFSDGGATYENVFVTGYDGILYADHYDPASDWVWANLGSDNDTSPRVGTLVSLPSPRAGSATPGSSSATPSVKAVPSPPAEAMRTGLRPCRFPTVEMR